MEKSTCLVSMMEESTILEMADESEYMLYKYSSHYVNTVATVKKKYVNTEDTV